MNDVIPIFMDIEASGLSEGCYPIEVGYCIGKVPIAPVSWLVRPHDTWTEDLWEDGAYLVHHIDRRECVKNGLDVPAMADRLNALLDGQTIFVDTTDKDQEWIDLLFRAAGVRRKFEIDWSVPLFDRVGEKQGLAIEQRWSYIEFVQRLAGQTHPHVHRAGPDAAKMAYTYALLTGEQAPQLRERFLEQLNDWLCDF